VRLPRLIGIFNEFPALRRIPARIVGLGFRPEHVDTPEVTRRRQGASRKSD
jgi:hypothetical protein